MKIALTFKNRFPPVGWNAFLKAHARKSTCVGDKSKSFSFLFFKKNCNSFFLLCVHMCVSILESARPQVDMCRWQEQLFSFFLNEHFFLALCVDMCVCMCQFLKAHARKSTCVVDKSMSAFWGNCVGMYVCVCACACVYSCKHTSARRRVSVEKAILFFGHCVCMYVYVRVCVFILANTLRQVDVCWWEEHLCLCEHCVCMYIYICVCSFWYDIYIYICIHAARCMFCWNNIHIYIHMLYSVAKTQRMP